MFDLNGDGYIDLQELKTVMTNMGEESLSDAEFKEIIKHADIDFDGKVNYEGKLFCVGSFLTYLYHVSGYWCSHNKRGKNTTLFQHFQNKNNRKIVEKSQIDNSNTQILYRVLTWLGAGTSIK